MSGVKDVFKNGWHPDKGTTFKQQVGSVFGKGGDGAQRHSPHDATPLSQLKDPASFAPPPKHISAHGGRPIAPPPPIAPRSSASPLQSQPQQPQPAAPNRHNGDSAAEEAPLPRPFRIDTTGLPTAHLPAPPVRKGTAGAAASPSPLTSAAVSPGPPKLPPRLPPRVCPRSSPATTSPATPSGASISPGSQSPALNQDAISRLGAAGISVPGLGIGSGSKISPSPHNPPAAPSIPQLGVLQARFAKLGSQSSSPIVSDAGSPPPPSEGTTYAQKQAALRTAANFRKDPTSVSLSDARSAASTMNNFRQRHGDQVVAGLKTANGINQKYMVTDKVAAYQHGTPTSSAPNRHDETPSGLSSLASAGASILTKKKPPPPPPPKRKPEQSRASNGIISDDDTPPPIPYATRPTF